MQLHRLGHAFGEITGHALVKWRSRYREIIGHDAVKYPDYQTPLEYVSPEFDSLIPTFSGNARAARLSYAFDPNFVMARFI